MSMVWNLIPGEAYKVIDDHGFTLRLTGFRITSRHGHADFEVHPPDEAGRMVDVSYRTGSGDGSRFGGGGFRGVAEAIEAVREYLVDSDAAFDALLAAQARVVAAQGKLDEVTVPRKPPVPKYDDEPF